MADGWSFLTCIAAGAVALAGLQTGVAQAADTTGPDANASMQALHRLLDAEWEGRLAQFPERATTIGDHRYDDRLTDSSPAAVAGRREHHRERLAAVRAIDRTRLQGEDRLSWDILAFNAGLDVREDELLLSVAVGHDAPWSADDSPLRVNQMAGPQFSLPQLVRATRFRDEGDYRNYLARLTALPETLRQLQIQLDSGRAAGWMPPRVALRRLPDQFASLLNADLAHHPLFAPFLAFPAEVSAAARAELSHAAKLTLHQAVIPAVPGFRRYLLRPAGPAAPGRPPAHPPSRPPAELTPR